MNLVVLCDFDGTITKMDTAKFALMKFAKGNWKSIDKQFEDGSITLEECLKKEFALVTASADEILEEVEEIIDFRPNFEVLVDYCSSNSVPLVVVSAGLDFLIDHFLKLKRWKKRVITYTAKTKLTPNGIEFVFPELFDTKSANFKQDLVRQYKVKGKRVVYIGDGSGDYEAAKEANLVFAIKGSKVAKLCNKHKVLCERIDDFREVVKTLKDDAIGSE